jgi:two-component system chemotaxis response regulator CheY
VAYNILIADNSTFMRRVVRKVPDISGVKAGSYIEAGGGHEAAAVLRSERVDLIPTDINMRQKDEERRLVDVRKDAVPSSIPGLIVSSNQSESRMQRLVEIVAGHYGPDSDNGVFTAWDSVDRNGATQ